MKYLLASILFFGLLWIRVGDTQAHVLVKDQTNTFGGVLHVNPDDDPVAGEPATLFLDPQIPEEKIDSMQLTIRGSDGAETVVDNTFTYIFPTQGVYELTFAVNSGGYNYIFTHTQLVSRGISTGPLDKPSYLWAEVFVAIAVIGLILLVVFAINYRKQIKSQSTF